MVRKRGRTAACTAEDARRRLEEAREFLDTAEVVDSANVAVSNAVLAGIAASDAACCSALGERSRGQDHSAAVELVTLVEPGGRDAGRSLQRLLSQKDAAQYGVARVSASTRKTALRQATALVDFATAVLQR
jgi:hypothetical protein